jgi:hypothetical protein
MSGNKIVSIQQGESLPFKFDRGGDSIVNWTCTISWKQFPADAATPTPRIVAPAADGLSWTGFLTNTETDGLAINTAGVGGLWWLTATLFNVVTDELEQIPVRFNVTEKWA